MAIQLFEKFPGVLALMSIKQDGNMRLNRDGFDEVIPVMRRKLFLEHWKIPENYLTSAILEHGNKVHIVNGYSPKYVQCDGLVTNIKNQFISITVADCLPNLFYDPENRVVGIAHAGWKGLVAGVNRNVIRAMIEQGAQRNSILAAIGPGICSSCYEFDLKHVAELGEWCKPYHIVRVDNEAGKVYLDLKRIAIDQLARENVDRIFVDNECTCCRKDKYFSARRQKINPPEAMIVVIGMV
jgi:polyphenol oxidase